MKGILKIKIKISRLVRVLKSHKSNFKVTKRDIDKNKNTFSKNIITYSTKNIKSLLNNQIERHRPCQLNMC